MPPLVKPVVARKADLGDQPRIREDQVDVVLRPWWHDDARQLRDALGDPEIQRWNLHRLSTVTEARDWIDRWNGRWRKRSGASWAVVAEKNPDIVLGQIAFRSLHLADGLAEVSCWVAPNARRRHVATDATRMLSDWAFTTLKLERLEIVHSTQNPASCPVARRAGFRIEGIQRSLQRHADGFHDMCLHSRIRSDDGEPIPPAKLRLVSWPPTLRKPRIQAGRLVRT
jgi:ribosomal-protein-alanine N-acetyltransferase